MPRRRRKRFPLGALLLLLALGAGGWTLWRFWPAQPTAQRTDAPVAVPQRAALDVCALAPAAAIARAAGRDVVQTRALGASTDVPAAGVCTIDFARGSVVVLVFTRESRTRGGAIADGAVYFRSVLTGLEYEFKEAPQMLTGLGDEAAVAGFSAEGEEPPQLVLRRGDMVLQLIARDLDRARAETVARTLLAGL
jgi:hypothetical protein